MKNTEIQDLSETFPCENCFVRPMCSKICDALERFTMSADLIDITVFGQKGKSYLHRTTGVEFKTPDFSWTVVKQYFGEVAFR